MKTGRGALLAVVVALGVTACSSNASAGAGNSPTPGFTTTCQIINTATDSYGNTTFDIKVSVTAQKAADITDVDVEMTKQGAPLPIQSYASGTWAGSDGGNGVLMSKQGPGLPAFVGAGKTWEFNTENDGSNPPEFSGGEGSEFTAMPDSCHVIVVATTSNPGNF
jgi:ABC-type glycerol-3-phosphate transport system substrate-binding protein